LETCSRADQCAPEVRGKRWNRRETEPGIGYEREEGDPYKRAPKTADPQREGDGHVGNVKHSESLGVCLKNEGLRVALSLS